VQVSSRQLLYDGMRDRALGALPPLPCPTRLPVDRPETLQNAKHKGGPAKQDAFEFDLASSKIHRRNSWESFICRFHAEPIFIKTLRSYCPFRSRKMALDRPSSGEGPPRLSTLSALSVFGFLVDLQLVDEGGKLGQNVV